jgi:CPA2 family monovalent cation:H+ antiporter-2
MILVDKIVLILTAAFTVVLLLNHLKLPSILGYLLLGVIVGPNGFGLIADNHTTAEIAEIGVVFLLFTIGLEFSLKKLMQLRHYVLYYGLAQVSLTTFFTALLGRMISLSIEQAMAMGAIVAMSSTAVVTKLLKEQNELDMPHGQRALGILLFQDLAVIPFLIMIPSLAHAGSDSVMLDLLFAMAKGTAAIGIILFIGRWLLSPLFSKVARLHSNEIFTITILVVALSSAWLTNYFGLSYALGAFIAGIMLGETEYRHEIAVDVRPFRDILLGFFFISIGLEVNISALFTYWQWVFLLLLALIVMKFALIFLICWHLKSSKLRVAASTAIVLAHGGEFSFAILHLATNYHLLPQDYAQVTLAAIFLSMLVAPIFIRYNQSLTKHLASKQQEPIPVDLSISEQQHLHDLKDHVIVCGYGRVGRNITTLLNQHGIKYIALDLEAEQVRQGHNLGENVYYGDAQHKELLGECKISHARALVITFYDSVISPIIIKQAKKLNPELKIIVRCYSEFEVDELYQMGAQEVIPESIEFSLMLSFHLLLSLDIEAKQAWQKIEEIRTKHYGIQDLS